MASNAQQIKELAAAVKALTEGSADVVKSLEEISKNFGETIKPARALGKELDKISGSLQDTVDYNDKIEDQLKDMHRASKELSRIKWMEGVTSEQAIKALTAQIEAMKKIKAATVENSAANKKLTDGLALLEQQLLDVGVASKDALSKDQAEKLHQTLSKLSDDTKEFGKNLDSIDFRRPQAKLTGFGTAMSGVFGGVLGSMKIMDSYGFKNLTTALHKMKVEALDVKKSMESGAGKKTREDVHKMFGVGANPTAGEKENYARMVAGKQAEKGALQNMADSSLRKLMEKRVAGGKGQTLTKMFAQGGGSITEGIGMNSIMGLTKFMGPIGIAITAIGGLLAAFGAVGARRKDTYDALGKGGLLGTGATPREAYNKMQKQLSHGSFDPSEGMFEKSVMGLNYEKNLTTIKAMVEGGIGVSALGNKNAFEELNNGRATNMMGGVMRNANYFGHNLGMSQEDSVALTSKAIGEFNMSFGETEDLFININRGVTAAGVSTTKYLGIIDNIAGQFSRFNKTMGDTVMVITAMGRSGKYTADYLSEMVNALMGKEKSDEHRAFAYSLMTQGDRKGVLRGRETAASAKGAELDEMLADAVEKKGKKASAMTQSELSDFIHEYHKDEKVGQVASEYHNLKLKAAATKGAIGKGGTAGAVDLAAIDANMGDDRQSRTAVHMSLLDTTIKNSGVKGATNAMDLLDPDKAAKLMQSMGMVKLAKLMEIDPKTLGQVLPDAFRQAAGSFRDSKIQEYMAGDKSNTTEEEKRANATAHVNKKYGATTADVLKNQEFLEQRRQGAFDFKMAGVISEKQRTAEEEKARENYKVILDPLTFIKNTLKAMLDKIIEMLTVVVDWFNKTFFSSASDKAAKAVEEMESHGWKAGGDHTEFLEKIKNDKGLATGEADTLRGFLKHFDAKTISPEAQKVLEKYNSDGFVTYGSLEVAQESQRKFTEDLNRGKKIKKEHQDDSGNMVPDSPTPPSATEAKKEKEVKKVVGEGVKALTLDVAQWRSQHPMGKDDLPMTPGYDKDIRNRTAAQEWIAGKQKEIEALPEADRPGARKEAVTYIKNTWNYDVDMSTKQKGNPSDPKDAKEKPTNQRGK